jgi:hypothetical protein
MKVILKGGSPGKNEEIKKFFMSKIFPILDFGIAIEPSGAVITVYEKKKDGTVDEYVDPTAEVIVELTEDARNMAMDPKIDADELKKYTGDFQDEALAIKVLQSLELDFSLEYYSCRYKPPTGLKSEPECKVHGSIEHMQSSTGECPGCGKL